MDVITTHINADFDSLGSMLALKNFIPMPSWFFLALKREASVNSSSIPRSMPLRWNGLKILISRK